MSAIISRWLESKYCLWVLFVFLAVANIILLFVIWTNNISIEAQYAPTLVNGLTTSVAVLIGFGATCLTMMRANYPQKLDTVLVGIFALMMPILLVLGAYVGCVFKSDFQTALRLLLSGFVIAFLLMFAILFSMLKEHW